MSNVPGPITVALRPRSLQVIAEALSQMPYRMAAPVIDEINGQLAEKEGQCEEVPADGQQ